MLAMMTRLLVTYKSRQYEEAIINPYGKKEDLFNPKNINFIEARIGLYKTDDFGVLPMTFQYLCNLLLYNLNLMPSEMIVL